MRIFSSKPPGTHQLRQSQPRHLWPQRRKPLKNSTISPEPSVLAEEIIEDLEAAVEQFGEIANDLA